MLDGKEPCGECHLQPDETCDICGAHMPKAPHSAVPPDHPLHEETAKLRETLFFMQRVAILAINRLGGKMQVDDKEWATAENADMQWKTVRREENLQPVLMVAVTLQGEAISVSQRDIENLQSEKAEANAISDSQDAVRSRPGEPEDRPAAERKPH